jgi:hypothetical protein
VFYKPPPSLSLQAMQRLVLSCRFGGRRCGESSIVLFMDYDAYFSSHKRIFQVLGFGISCFVDNVYCNWGEGFFARTFFAAAKRSIYEHHHH